MLDSRARAEPSTRSAGGLLHLMHTFAIEMIGSSTHLWDRRALEGRCLAPGDVLALCHLPCCLVSCWSFAKQRGVLPGKEPGWREGRFRPDFVASGGVTLAKSPVPKWAFQHPELLLQRGAVSRLPVLSSWMDAMFRSSVGHWCRLLSALS